MLGRSKSNQLNGIDIVRKIKFKSKHCSYVLEPENVYLSYTDFELSNSILFLNMSCNSQFSSKSVL
jgi:hypothetical protein